MQLRLPQVCQRLVIERILEDAGFKKLKRRTNKELWITGKRKFIPQRSEHLDFDILEPFNIDCPVAGVFFFLPYIIESGIVNIVKKCKLPHSSDIDSIQACLSMLLLKLIGNERLSHMDAYDQEPGLGIFAGLTLLPKSIYMSTYSCRTSEEMLLNFQQEIINQFYKIYPTLYQSKFFNMDFHSIPHSGYESVMEKVWCGSKGKTMKGANTIFVQDSQSNAILYTQADILRSEGAQEIKKFVSFRIHFDILWTLIADTLYHQFARNLRRFEKLLAPTIFKKFINMPGRVVYNENKFIIKIRKRAYTPILKSVKKLSNSFPVPWLDNKHVKIDWTA